MRVQLDCVSRGAGQINEDYAAVSLAGDVGALVVLDGVGGSGVGCRHGVPWFTARLGGELLRLACARADASLADCLGEAIARTAGAHATSCDLTQVQTPQSTVVAARWHGDRLDHLVLSDSMLLIRGRDRVVRPVLDKPLDRLEPGPSKRLSALREVEEAHPVGSAERAAAAEEYARVSRGLRNSPGGFFTAAADPDVAAKALTGTLPRSEVRSLAALTDGAGNWVETFGLGTWTQCVELLEREGPQGLICRVRTAERADAGRDSFPRDKSVDDAAVVFVEFDGAP
ncbi:protein phosphatase 2C domain-containing protein [Streptomyces sp. NPDC002669]|uniref:protein phosphatase 2C domain-containing protein n=1 Tax=Streptomyces sp. NPDC002669 TaxID=3364658 RepID=UPI0036ADB9E0